MVRGHPQVLPVCYHLRSSSLRKSRDSFQGKLRIQANWMTSFDQMNPMNLVNSINLTTLIITSNLIDRIEARDILIESIKLIQLMEMIQSIDRSNQTTSPSFPYFRHVTSKASGAHTLPIGGREGGILLTLPDSPHGFIRFHPTKIALTWHRTVVRGLQTPHPIAEKVGQSKRVLCNN